MNSELKQEVHKLVDECKDDSLLQEAKVLLDTKKDWWDELTEEQQAELIKQTKEPDEKDTLSYEEYHKATERWRIK
jgi:hypothetical protein